MYDTSPAYETMKRLYSSFHEYKRGFSLSAVDIETGEVVLLTDKNTPMEHLDKAVIASASVPGFFPPTKIGGRLLVDGMTAWNTNVQEAIDRCRKEVEFDSSIIIDVLICHPMETVPHWDEAGNTYENYMRVRDLRRRVHSSNAVDGVMRAHPHINWRHKIH